MTSFLADGSGKELPDANLTALTHLPNVLVTSHEGFFTQEEMEQIAHTRLNNLTYLEQGRPGGEPLPQEQLPADAVVVGW